MTATDLSVVFRDATVYRTPNHRGAGDLWVTGTAIERIAPAGTPPPDGAEVVDASGCSLVPLLVESALAGRPPAEQRTYDLAPGNPATFAVIRGGVSAGAVTRMLVVSPRDLAAVLVRGHPVVRDGAPTRPAGADRLDPDDPRLGAWVDEPKQLVQYLRPGGRYSETRSGRVDAYTGRFWLDHDRITYLDDQGFWAFGQYVDGVLHHAGFVLRRR